MEKPLSNSTVDTKIGFLKKARASICHHCPMCISARNKPDSFFGKILGHKLHSENCPMWKAEQEVYPGKNS